MLADIGVALGAFGASGRGQNEALQILNSRVQQDFDVQKAQIEKAKDSVLMAKTGIADADQARAMALDDLEIKRNAAMQAIEARLVAGKTAQVGDRTLAEGEMKKAGFAKDIQERKERTTAGMATRTTSTSNYVNPAAIEAKAGARKTAATDKENQGIVFDENNKPIGRVTTGRGGAQAFMTRDADYTRATQQLAALQQDIAQNGERVFSPAAAKRRHALLEDAKIAVATVSPLGKTNEAMEAEGGSIGANHGIFGGMVVGDNPEAIRNKLNQLKEQQQRYRAQGLVPLGREPIASASSVNEGQTAAPKAAQTPPHLDSALVTQAREILSDSQAPKAVKDRARELLLAARTAGN